MCKKTRVAVYRRVSRGEKSYAHLIGLDELNTHPCVILAIGIKESAGSCGT